MSKLYKIFDSVVWEKKKLQEEWELKRNDYKLRKGDSNIMRGAPEMCPTMARC